MRYHNILHDDMLNGAGLRVTIFFAGCHHDCHGCQNPQTHDYNGGIPFDDEAILEVMNAVSPYWIDGITISGGDGLAPGNIKEMVQFCTMIKYAFPCKTIWLYTGNVIDDHVLSNPMDDYESDVLKIMNIVDVIVDGPYVEHLSDIRFPYRGSTNQRLIDCNASIERKTIITIDIN